MVELGVLHATGAGVARDDAQAQKLFERAAQAGNPRGVSNLAALGGGAAASANPARARELLGKGAETNSEAQYQLGMMLAEGEGGTKDDVAARALFEKAAAQNHPGALERMGAFEQEGRGGPKDSDAAKAYYQRAAALGDEDAKKALERARYSYAIKDKRGNVVTNLCFGDDGRDLGAGVFVRLAAWSAGSGARFDRHQAAFSREWQAAPGIGEYRSRPGGIGFHRRATWHKSGLTIYPFSGPHDPSR